MGKFKTVKRFAKPALLTVSSILVMNLAHGAPTWPTESASQWRVTRTGDQSSVHLINTVPAGSLHAICRLDKCDMFVEPASGCIPGQTYPVMVNSAHKVGIVSTRCRAVNDAGKLRIVAHLKQSSELVAAMIRSQDLSIAFPTQAGQMEVLNIRMKGASTLLADALRKIKEPSGSSAQTERPKSAANRPLPAIVSAGTIRYHI